MSMFIDFTEYVLPNGRQRVLKISVPDDIGKMARDIENDGERRFECETLRTGQISLTIVGENDDGDQDDLDIEIADSPHTRDVVLATLIKRFHAKINPPAVLDAKVAELEGGK